MDTKQTLQNTIKILRNLADDLENFEPAFEDDELNGLLDALVYEIEDNTYPVFYATKNIHEDNYGTNENKE